MFIELTAIYKALWEYSVQAKTQTFLPGMLLGD